MKSIKTIFLILSIFLLSSCARPTYSTGLEEDHYAPTVITAENVKKAAAVTVYGLFEGAKALLEYRLWFH